MSKLLAEVMNEVPCANKVVVYVWSLMIHSFPVVNIQSCVCMSAGELRFRQSGLKVSGLGEARDIHNPVRISMVLIAAGGYRNLDVLVCSCCDYYRPVLRKTGAR